MIERVAISPNKDKDRELLITKELIGGFEDRGVRIYVEEAVAHALARPDLGCPAHELPLMGEILVTLGGDGTVLYAVRQVYPHGTPILGINLGHLGFLTELEVPEIEGFLDMLIAGDYSIDERIMLEGFLLRDGERIADFSGLNDVVISKGAMARMIRLETFIGSEYVATYPADGLIISSPTGSTAYSLSAGGPILAPNLDVLVITPICAHTFYTRPLVIARDQEVRVRVSSGQQEVMVTVDGQLGLDLKSEDEVRVRISKERVKLVRLKNRSFYEVLRDRLSQGRI